MTEITGIFLFTLAVFVICLPASFVIIGVAFYTSGWRLIPSLVTTIFVAIVGISITVKCCGGLVGRMAEIL